MPCYPEPALQHMPEFKISENGVSGFVKKRFKDLAVGDCYYITVRQNAKKPKDLDIVVRVLKINKGTSSNTVEVYKLYKRPVSGETLGKWTKVIKSDAIDNFFDFQLDYDGLGTSNFYSRGMPYTGKPLNIGGYYPPGSFEADYMLHLRISMTHGNGMAAHMGMKGMRTTALPKAKTARKTPIKAAAGSGSLVTPTNVINENENEELAAILGPMNIKNTNNSALHSGETLSANKSRKRRATRKMRK